MPSPFDGRTILVPAARIGRNVLADILRRRGANVRTFPTLSGKPPADSEPLARSIEELATFDWIVFSGEIGARFFLDRWGGRGPLPAKVATIGIGATAEFKSRHRPPDVAPREHVAQAVADALGGLNDSRVLLIRGNRGSADLPNELARRGARVVDVVGFQVVVEASAEQAHEALVPPLEMVAFGSPSSVRVFTGALRDLSLDVERCLGGVVIAAAGRATALQAADCKLEPDLVAKGHLADFVRDLDALWGGGS